MNIYDILNYKIEPIQMFKRWRIYTKMKQCKCKEEDREVIDTYIQEGIGGSCNDKVYVERFFQCKVCKKGKFEGTLEGREEVENKLNRKNK